MMAAAPLSHVMAYEKAKLLLEQAKGFSQRTEAIRQAIALGMPLSEIEQYLDWLDQRKPPTEPSEEVPSGDDLQ
jgi:DNA-binding transcriptional MerR regulator